MARCIIVGAGEVSCNINVNDEDFVIAADGGYTHLCKQNITPNLLLGDFDSYEGSLPCGIETLRYPIEKDETDMYLAYLEGKKRGYTDFLIYGALGGRLDHTLANISLLFAINSADGCHGIISDGNTEISVITDGGEAIYDESEVGSISVFAIGGNAEGVTVSGLKYEAKDVTLRESFALGVSNSFIGKKAGISVRRGSILIVRSGKS